MPPVLKPKAPFNNPLPKRRVGNICPHCAGRLTLTKTEKIWALFCPTCNTFHYGNANRT